MKKRTMNILLALALVLSFNLLAALPAAAETSEVWVAPTGDDGNAGTESEPFASIQKGIDAVSSPGKVHVAAGTYEELIVLVDNVEVLGAGADVTTIDGAGAGTVVTASYVGPGTRLDGFTITGGNNYFAGGMTNVSSSTVVTNCNFTGNTATYGGGMYNESGSPAVISCIFSGNSANSYGGGMYNAYTTPTVINCIFSGNWAVTGGAIDNEYWVTLTLSGSTFSGNSATYGGAIHNLWASVDATNCIFWGDTPEEIDSDTLLEITYCDVQGGYAGTGNINADPLFAGDDLHPGAGSPCIDAGNDGAVPADTFDIDSDGDTAETLPIDLDGGPRILGTVDMGAYETQSDEPEELLVADAGGPYTADEGAPFTIDAAGSTDPAGGDCSYDWDLDGDGAYDDAAGVTPTVTFASDGLYTIGLQMTNAQGEQATDTASVTINDLSPTAALTGDDTLGEGQPGAYDASGSSSSPDAITGYEWDWDYDGVSFNPSGDTGMSQTHVWGGDDPDILGVMTAGTDNSYTIAMRVTDEDGSMDIATLTVTITIVDPEVMVDDLAGSIDELELPDNLDNGLSSSLDTALKTLGDTNDNNDAAAINALEAFINKVESQAGKKISEEDAEALIAQALLIIAAIGGGS